MEWIEEVLTPPRRAKRDSTVDSQYDNDDSGDGGEWSEWAEGEGAVTQDYYNDNSGGAGGYYYYNNSLFWILTSLSFLWIWNVDSGLDADFLDHSRVQYILKRLVSCLETTTNR